MNSQSSNRPPYHAFLSYSRKDSLFVDPFERWLKAAGLNVLRDASDFSAGLNFTTKIAECIEQSRTLIAVVSRNSVESKWVNEEWEQAVNKQVSAGSRSSWRFNVLPVCIDDSLEVGNVPRWLDTRNGVILRNGSLDLATADSVLSALSGWHTREHRELRDAYVSFGWQRKEEIDLAAAVLKPLDAAGFRLIGDADDQATYSLARVEEIIASCGALIGVLPHRGDGGTSKYIVQEVEAARKRNVPYVLFCDDGVQVDPTLVDGAMEKRAFPARASARNQTEMSAILEVLGNEWRPPASPPYVFFSADFRPENDDRRTVVRRMIERITSLKCWMGDDLAGEDAGSRIAHRITSAALVVADISDNNLNSCIEAGIAVGAGRELRLLSSSKRRESPFMFRTRNIAKYGDDVEMLGAVHRLVSPFRRRVWNRDLEL